MMIRSLVVVLVAVIVGCTDSEPEDIVDARSAGGLAFDLVGGGEYIVLIHGTNLDRRLWDQEVEWLADEFRVLRYDLRGQGRSAFPTTSYSNHIDLIELLDDLEAGQVTLVGLSAGVQVALDVALTAPDRVRRMVLVSPSMTGFVPAEAPAFLSELTDAIQARDFDQANRVLLDSPLMLVPAEHSDRVRMMVEDNTRLWTMPYDLVDALMPPALERLEDILTPTLVLVGENDVGAIRAQGELLASRLGEARLVTIPGGGHLLNLTSPDSFRRTLNEFVDAEN